MNNAHITRKDPEKNRGGAWIRFGDEEYKVPALGFGAVIELQESVKSLSEIGTSPTASQANTVAEIVYRALRRNYPSIAKEEVADMIDLSNYQQVLVAVLNVSGFERAKDGASGEEEASTGTASTLP